MPILLVDHQSHTRGSILPSRLLIGRRSMNHLVIDDPTVSRMHAWIDQRGADYILTDMRSRTGTRVNGQPLAKRRKLVHGDSIQIGPATLTFRADDQLPAGVEPLALPSEPVLAARDLGIRFDCPHCRAPMWASAQYAGHGGICTYCGDGFTIPRTIVTAPPGQPTETSHAPATGFLAPPPAMQARVPGSPTQAPPIQAPPIQADDDFMAPIVPLPPPTDGPEGALAVQTRVSMSGRGMLDVEQPEVQPDNGHNRSGVPSGRSGTEPAPMAVPAGFPGEGITAFDLAVAPSDYARQDVTLPQAQVPSPRAFTPRPPDAPAIPASAGVNGHSPVGKATAIVAPRPDAYSGPPVADLYKCGVCHSPILVGEAQTACPSCNLKFHVECWQENYGCSAYGCLQVNALAPPPDPSAEAEPAIDDATMDIAAPRTPWEYLLLGLSALGALASAFSFGVVSLIMMIWSVVYLSRSRGDPDRKAGPVYGAIALSLIGVVGGPVVSYFRFLYGRG